ncbi:MAG: hypothetical protein Q4G51_11215 [Dermatophilus congolensis]|nr:hypothetical protein [Dermatophilus congolensis]
MTGIPTNPPPTLALARLARLPEQCAPDCGHGLTQRDVAAALASLAARAAALLPDHPERNRLWDDHDDL